MGVIPIPDFNDDSQPCCSNCDCSCELGCVCQARCVNGSKFRPKTVRPEPTEERKYAPGATRLVSVFVEHYIKVPAGLSDKEVEQEIVTKLELDEDTGFSWKYEKSFPEAESDKKGTE